VPDKFPREKRSEIMSRVKGQWTSCETRAHNKLKGMRIRHTMHPDIIGRPDILLHDANTVVFIDGCFWHRCPAHFRMPSSRRSYWKPKIEGNVKRDRRSRARLRRQGYKVVSVWEHEVRDDLDLAVQKMLRKAL